MKSFLADLSFERCQNLAKMKWHQGCMRKAPSSLITSPFSIGFSIILCTRCPNSAGSPRRLGKGTVLPSSSLTFSGKLISRGVRKSPKTLQAVLLVKCSLKGKYLVQNYILKSNNIPLISTHFHLHKILIRINPLTPRSNYPAKSS